MLNSNSDLEEAILSRSTLINDIAAFAKTFPKIMLSINFSDIQQDLIREGIDLAIRIGNLKDSTLKSKRLFTMKRKLIVSPDVMHKYKVPQRPQDLLTWDWIGLKMRPNQKTLIHEKGKKYIVNFDPTIIADSMDAVCQFAIAGLGLATPPAFLVSDDLQKGSLLEPLPEWQAEPLSVYMVWPPNVSKESLTFRLIAFLEARKKSYFD